MKDTYKQNTRRVKLIANAARKYDRTRRKFTCKYDAQTESYIYRLIVAKRGSGKRTGRLVGDHAYTLINLYPEHREVIESITAESIYAD